MRQNLYTQIWMDNLSRIIEVMKDGGGEIQLKKQDFEAAGNRLASGYDFNLTIYDANVPRIGNSAVARNLKRVLDSSDEFQCLAEGYWKINFKNFLQSILFK